ncbi:MAG TPA: late competence development ComFB family protein [Leptospiraceae bacterium]|nr:late competence development ComFB family protein [Leptospiraceae bacterium]HMW05143.1 late competence development ComFB family protein [Leptospiraceae bacterium]HMX32596.1 late competence development ComFB family protein [Leptospiraceae bacterium]HMY32482.1 late competence development ComFB family protein [Leptospiraceae bacterium]HMZ66622.1 late competence development ComFB family protein [Leptospiraceae bacterium]
MGQSNIVHIEKWTSKVSNSVEEDIRSELKNIIQENPAWGWEQISIQDVYAYALNQLPPIYSEKGKKPEYLLSIEEIRNAIYTAIRKIEENPIHYTK